MEITTNMGANSCNLKISNIGFLIGNIKVTLVKIYIKTQVTLGKSCYSRNV